MPSPAWLRIGCGPRRLCSGARLRAHISPTRQDIIARVFGAQGPLMAHLLHLFKLLRAVADFISGGGALCLHGPRARSRLTHIAHPRRPTREGGPPASAGVRLTTGARETEPPPPPPHPPPPTPPSPPPSPYPPRAPPPPLARCVQVMRIDAGGAVQSVYLELGGDLGLHQHLPAVLRMGSRQGFGRGGRGGKRRGPDGDPGRMPGRGRGGTWRTYIN